MVWNSIQLMTVIDLLTIGVTSYVGFKIHRDRICTFLTRQFDYQRMIDLSLLVIVMFFTADLIIMWLAPLVVGPEISMSAMETLHLQLSWFMIPPAVCGIAFGVLRATRTTTRALEQRETFDNVTADWFWQTDRHGRIVWESDNQAETPGRVFADIEGLTREEIAGDLKPAGGWQAYLQALLTHAPFSNFEYCYPDRNGAVNHARLSGQPLFDRRGAYLGHRGIAADITELRQAHEALAQCEAKFRDFAETSSDWLWETDAEGRVIWESELGEGAGWQAHETAIGKTRVEIAGERAAETDWLPYQKALDERREFRAFEYCYSGVDLCRRYARISGKPVFDQHGTFIGHRGVAANITEFKETEESLRQAQRMEAVGQLTGGIAHDFNNLLAIILGNADLLGEMALGEMAPGEMAQGEMAQGEMAPGDSQAEHCIGAIIRASLRGSSLTGRLLAFSRRQNLSPVEADVSALIRDLEDMLRRTLGETIEFSTGSEAGLWPATIDPHQFENAVINLAINAGHAMPDGGELRIQAANVTLDASCCDLQNEVTPGDYVEVVVQDSGSGIAPEVLKKVFEPFFTTKEVGVGSGLGLSMVYGFAKQSGGHVEIQSDVDNGTTVRLYLPRTAD